MAICVSDVARACDDGGITALLASSSSVMTILLKNPHAAPAVTGRGNFRGISRLLGQCKQPNQNNLRHSPVDTYHLVARDDEARAFNDYFKSHPNEHWTRDDGTPIDVTDFIAIDVVARTLMGEMGWEGMCGKGNLTIGKGYMAGAARVIMNRGIQILNEPDRYAKMFGSGRACSDFSQCIANAALMRSQFSLWNKLRFDENAARQLARSKNPKKRNKGLSELAENNTQERVANIALCPVGTASQPAAASSLHAWHDAVELAIEAVTNSQRLKNETPDISALWYTSNMTMRGGIALPDGHAYGRLLSNNKCLQLWKDGGAVKKKKP